MRQPRLITQLFWALIGMAVFTASGVYFHINRVNNQFFLRQTVDELGQRAKLVSELILPHWEEGPDRIQQRINTLSGRANTRITVVSQDGTVLAETNAVVAEMENHKTPDRHEIMSALGGAKGVSRRESETLGNTETLYVAVPVFKDHRVVGVVRLAVTWKHFLERRQGVMSETLGGLGVLVVIAGLFSVFLSRRFSRPLGEIVLGAKKFAEGNLDERMPRTSSEEVNQLANVLDDMATQLRNQFDTINEQKQYETAVLSSMIEGVIAIDNDENILNINYSIGKMLRFDPEHAKGMPLQEVVRNNDLLELFRNIPDNNESLSGEIDLHGVETRHFKATGVALHNAQGHKIGSLVVLSDMTREYRLERVRRDFVSNVSHELRTPITTIKGFVETLLNGALDSREDAERFLDIIVSHIDRLHHIIEDLLTLSRLEQDEDSQRELWKEIPLTSVISNVVESARMGHGEDAPEVVVEESASIRINANPVLLEQALANLVQNAIKYAGDSNSPVVLRSYIRDENTARIEVQDHGPGIAKEHLPRLFERFYRVDKARTRKVGGTGLGLAIVKHIVLSHGGNVSVQSAVGKGSTFILELPLSS